MTTKTTESGETLVQVARPSEAHIVVPVNLQSNPKECLSCRIIGTGATAGVGSYAIWQSRTTAQGSRAQKNILAGLGVALLVGSAFRWYK
ncbi:hypothetical protein B0H34DRAFT_357726 [Crassisporium funariophilum]|nr:hypothetical protein B0H34DRAFT_357726 [Crassisporium funariophilum]